MSRKRYSAKRLTSKHPTPHAYSEERREEILRAYEERRSLRGVERTCGYPRTEVDGVDKQRQRSASASAKH